MQRSALKGRDFQVDLASRLGKTQVVTNSTPLNQQVRRLLSIDKCGTICTPPHLSRHMTSMHHSSGM